MPIEWIYGLIGGGLIGLAASFLAFSSARVLGVSGITYGSFTGEKGDRQWRIFFLAGLLLGGLALRIFNPQIFGQGFAAPLFLTPIAGFLVGFGAALGSGCTSGHGVCGVSRLSVRSIAATVTFLFSGFATVAALRYLGWLA